jgi:homoserine kinase
VIARVPASTANLGPGFDALAIALSLYVTVTVTEADAFSLTSSGCGAGSFDGPDHLAAQVARSVLGHDRFALSIHSDIPVARGLGSSAAVAIAAAAAAGGARPVDAGVEIDGHGENAAASAFGGLVAARMHKGELQWRRAALDERWRFVVAIPDRELSTDLARRALPSTVPFADAVANVGNVALLLAGLARVDDYVAGSMNDRLHQPYRESLFPESRSVLLAMRDAGAHDSCWSGAGSTLLALVTPESVDEVERATRDALFAQSVAGEVRVVEADHRGVLLSAN